MKFILLYLLPFFHKWLPKRLKCQFSIVYSCWTNNWKIISDTSLYSLFYVESKNVKIYRVIYLKNHKFVLFWFLGHSVYFLLILKCEACVPLHLLYLHFFKIVANKEVILLCRTNWPPCIYIQSLRPGPRDPLKEG